MISDDLATLREWADAVGLEVAIGNVEAEIARLEQGMANGDRLLSQAGRQLEAAEAEVARLRDGLRLLEQAVEHMEFAHYPQVGDGAHLADPFDLMRQARALLAEDGAT